MARRKDHTRVELKEMALKAARKLIIEKGNNGFSVREVAKKIGYSVGTMYQVFKNIDDLIVHINAGTLDEMQSYLNERLVRSVNPSLDMAVGYFEFANSNPNLWLTIFEHRYSSKFKLPDWYKEKLQTMFDNAEKVFSTKNDELKDSRKKTISIWASIHGVTILSITNKLEIVNSIPARVLIRTIINQY